MSYTEIIELLHEARLYKREAQRNREAPTLDHFAVAVAERMSQRHYLHAMKLIADEASFVFKHDLPAKL